MTTELREVIAALNRLIETAKDGEQGFLPPPEGTHLAGPVAGRTWWSPG